MNNIISLALIAGGLSLLGSPEAAAHKAARNLHQPAAYYHVDSRRAGHDLRRAHHMPRWLKRNKSFRRWYKRTPLRRSYGLGWYQLFELYNWERAALRHHRFDHEHDRDRQHRRRH